VLTVLLPVLLAQAWRVRRAPVVGDLDERLLPAPSTPQTPDYVLGVEQLVYWIPEVEGGNWRVLPEGAELVGTVRSGALERTPPTGKRAVAYSLPHQLVNPTLKDLYAAPTRVESGP
jgi:hypothetical protein